MMNRVPSFAPRALCAAMVLVLAGCSDTFTDDLRSFVDNSGKGLVGKVPALPAIAPYTPVNYIGAEMPDPFSAKRPQLKNNSNVPDTTRKREFLENFPLDRLRMAGTIERNKVTWALVFSPDGNLNMVRSGNYMGQNFGRIDKVSEEGVLLKESVQDTNGDWTEREITIDFESTSNSNTPKR